MKIAVIGAGAWGTALAAHFAARNKDVTLWAREPEVVESLNKIHENSLFLPNVHLSEKLKITNDIAEAIDGAEVVLLVPPAQFLRGTCKSIKPILDKNAAVVLCCKGIEQGSLKLMTEVAEEELENDIYVLSGPSFAREVALGQPTVVNLAGELIKETRELAENLTTKTLIVKPMSDRVGTEIAGAIKNVVAITCGIAQGLGMGENAKAVLLTIGYQEMTKLCLHKGGDKESLTKPCGLGDLVLTATSTSSRNFALGLSIGKGANAQEVMKDRRSVAEGVASASALYDLCERDNLKLPLVTGTHKVLQGNLDAHIMLRSLWNTA
jgi:glycerol-3-phosphate dehydrogenase (NAD(P)+)